MSDYEILNQKVTVQKAVRRKAAMKRLVGVLAIVLVVILAFVGLEYIGFINDVFMVILIAITMCTGSFQAGRIWSGVKR